MPQLTPEMQTRADALREKIEKEVPKNEQGFPDLSQAPADLKKEMETFMADLNKPNGET